MVSLALHLKSNHHEPPLILLKTTANLSFSHFFSSSSSSSSDDNNNNNNNNNGGNTPQKPSNFSAYFSEVRSRLKQQEQSQSTGFRPSNLNQKAASLDEIRKNLSEFGRTSVGSSQQQTSSFQDLYYKNVVNPNPNPNIGGENKPGDRNFTLESIKESLIRMRTNEAGKGRNVNNRMSLNDYKASFRLRPTMADSGGVSKVIGGSLDNLPSSVFGREMREKEMEKGKEEGGDEDDEMSKMELVRMYSHGELGEKLRELRPEAAKTNKKGGVENWFSLTELSERLKKLKEIEEKQSAARIGLPFGELRSYMDSLKFSKDGKPAKNALQRYDLLSHPISSPKEHLVEKYFHPDNMSAEEKLKLELKRVRDEFKMHESDCGSARVQIAQLTTEILHLSSVLHKKDKHSRRGLLAKVQQRKKLLKYLRRTDWESYCFVLSKLGLRDNPDYKN